MGVGKLPEPLCFLPLLFKKTPKVIHSHYKEKINIMEIYRTKGLNTD